ASSPDWNVSADDLLQLIWPQLEQLYGIHRSELIGLDLRKSPCAYPVLQVKTEPIHRSIGHQTPYKNLFVAGRTGMFQYRMLEGCYESAMTCVEAMTQAMSGNSIQSYVRPATDRYGRPEVVPE